jgi:lipopolysaccharide biosynthesis glycosyltransferase
MTKLAVVTRSDSNIDNISKETHPLLKKYAEKCNADFIVLSGDPPIWTHDHRPHYRIMDGYDLLNTYDRVLFLDSDMIVTDTCPNLFDVVPENKIGSIYEDKGSRKSDRLKRIQNIQSAWGDVGWKENYTNAGTFLVSRMHKDIFSPHEGKYWTDWGSADVHLSYMIHKNNFNVYELPFQYNHMTMFSEDWNENANRFDSYIIHYGGAGVFDSDINSREEQIKRDKKKLFSMDR